jgi:hypothetical protein
MKIDFLLGDIAGVFGRLDVVEGPAEIVGEV